MSDTDTRQPQGFTVHEKRFWTEEGELQGPDPSSDKAAPADQAGAQTLSFQAETQQLLELMIHSLYSHKEIFLRELISNASDALDRYRFAALTDKELHERDDLEIRLEVDRQRRTLTIHDNGIGMSRDELVRNIGTIARSGTRELLSQLRLMQKEGEAGPELIGQFGVGFYSAFMVADRVRLVTRKPGAAVATAWASDGGGAYTIEAGERADHGTSVTLELKDASEEDGIADLTEEWVLDGIVKRYSDFVRYPIKLAVERSGPARDEEGNASSAEKTETRIEERTLNSMKAIWMRSAQEVKDEEYDEFYRHISHDWEKPLRRMALAAEGRIEYRALLFLPSRAASDLFYQGTDAGLQLYVRNVKIMDKCEALIPRYLRFVKGVVDSPDLPLNVSRELLQQNRQLTQIRRGVVKKVLATFKELLDKDRETYLKLWSQFSRAIKEGVLTEEENRERVLEVVLFASAAAGAELTTLDEYLARMKEGQEEIYYLTGESRQVIEGSPHLEAFRERGYEVLFLTDPVDELLVELVATHGGKKLRSVGKGDVALGSDEERDADKQAKAESEEHLLGLFQLLQKKLDRTVKTVRLSSRLTSSAVCLVSDEQDHSPQLERLLRQTGTDLPTQRRILELNGGHAVVVALRQRFEKDPADPLLDEYAELLYGQALLAEGSQLPDPAAFSALVANLIARSA